MITPKASRFARQEVSTHTVVCRAAQREEAGLLVNGLEAKLLASAQDRDAALAGGVAQHMVGAIALFPLKRIEIHARSRPLGLADEDGFGPDRMADMRIRFVGVSPKGLPCGFSLVLGQSPGQLYFVLEDGDELVSVPETAQWHAHMTLRQTLE